MIATGCAYCGWPGSKLLALRPALLGLNDKLIFKEYEGDVTTYQVKTGHSSVTVTTHRFSRTEFSEAPKEGDKVYVYFLPEAIMVIQD